MFKFVIFVAGFLLGMIVNQPFINLAVEVAEEHVCWAPNVKAAAQEAVQAQGLAALRASLPYLMSQPDREKVLASFHIGLDSYFTKGVLSRTLEADCGAAVHVTYQRPDGTVVKDIAGHVVAFTVYPGEKGSTPVMSNLDLAGLNLRYTPE
jgi:hypothetical protein